MWRERLYGGYVRYWLPVALVLFLTGMFWVGDRSLYHKLYYASLAFPTLVVLATCTARFTFLRREPLFLLVLIFSAYVILSLAWAVGKIDFSKIKHPLYIVMLILAVAALAEHDMRRLIQVVGLAGVAAALSAVITMILYFKVSGPPSRLEGFGALYNPLLTSHVYGFFAALWLAAFMSSSRVWAGKLIMLMTLVLLLFFTGSRTPFMALGVCFVWLVVMVADRRIVWLLMLAAISTGLGLWFFGAELLARGLSYRPLIWAETWRQIMPALWFGHGYDTSIDIFVPGLNRLLADPHNLTLGVIYQTGLFGGLMWLAIYLYGFLQSWKMRRSGLVLISSTLLMYGFVAGMTEGSSFMSRPKEHWFLIWIPIAIHLAVLRKVSIKHKATKKETVAAG
ncbi:O-antigen ligase family protein [Pseudomonas sp. GOM7]|uniref:O-antigen ligase family protein n=1 Tax=Pseudomonas sp. GOM7 TaxID=2998079 RepID=UPI00227CB03A|nr:O-antigen ligase family protein [Pseudomonas sp. GOM7]WAJ38170.1 O-antigen ligase family protein [Pseudomonas sp. GOM7]